MMSLLGGIQQFSTLTERWVMFVFLDVEDVFALVFLSNEKTDEMVQSCDGLDELVYSHAILY